MNEEANELRRVRWRCRRGLLELDLILQAFADYTYPALGAHERKAFRRLLATPDATLLEYLNGAGQPQETELTQIVNKLRQSTDF
ncbi:MAG: succinate dehydrogenase assembly factor 2 [Acidiferrobacterales bacterium]